MHLHRPWLPAAALLIALAVVPLAPGAARADTDYAAACSARLRAAPSLSAATLDTIPTGVVVTTTGVVAGDAWSATCITAVAGDTWYAISAVNGVSVAMRYGVAVVFAATGLFQAAVTPPVVQPPVVQPPVVQPPPPTQPSAYVEGIDVSNWQQTIDWTQVAAAGKRFAIMKVTEGQTYLDPYYATNHAGARAAGLQVTAYHFANPSNAPDDAILEADWFVQNAALLPGDLVPALDLEQNGGLSPTALQAWVGTWLGEVQARLGVRPMIYTSPNFWKNSMADTTMFADQGYGVLWIAHWFVASPTVPANDWGGRGWTFWQYDDCGSVPGISGCVDLDRYNGTDLTPVVFGYSVPAANPAPVLTASAPPMVAAGGPEQTITLEGANFVSGVSIAYMNGLPLPTAFISPTSLTAVVPAGLAQGTAMLTVVNEPPGGGVSAPLPMAVTIPAAQLTVTPSATIVNPGQQATLEVAVAGSGANRAVTLQRMATTETQWSDVATLTTDASGHASFAYTPTVTTRFQAVFAGAPDLGPGTSPAAAVAVRQTILLRPTNPGRVASVRAGTKVTFTATVRPVGPGLALAKVSFTFWRLVSGRWTQVAKRDAYADASGRARWTWTFTTRGQWYVRAIANATPTSAGSAWSQVERYAVN